MKAMNIKEFYESFSSLDGKEPNEAGIYPKVFDSEIFKTQNQDNRPYQEHGQFSKGGKSFQNKNNYLHASYNNDTNFLPAGQPVQSHLNQLKSRNEHFTYNKTSKKFNNRLEHLINSFENTYPMPNCESSIAAQAYVNPINKHLVSKSFTKYSDPSNHSDHIFTRQYNKYGGQYISKNKPISYDRMENVCSDYDLTNLLPPCHPSTSSQSTGSQQCSSGNISINIGNSASLLCCQNSTKSNILTNHCPNDNLRKSFMPASNQSFLDTGKNGYNIINNSFLPNNGINKHVYFSNNMKNNRFMTNDQDCRENQENKNPNDQTIDISKTIENIPFERFTDTNGYFGNTLTNPSININNIKSINVHVHHSGNVSSLSVPDIQQGPSPLSNQKVPLMPTKYVVETSPYNPLPNESNTMGHSLSLKGDYFSDESRSTSTNINPSEADFADAYSGAANLAIKDDIYLPSCEETSVTFDIDKWLNTIEVTPLESHSKEFLDFNIASKLGEVKNNVPNITTTRKRKKRTRTQINHHNLEILEQWFRQEPYPNYEEKQTIAEQIGFSVDTVRIWFQNRRQMLKKGQHGLKTLRNKKADYKEPTLPAQLGYTTIDTAMYPPQITSNMWHDVNKNNLVNNDGFLMSNEDPSFVP